MYVKKHLIFKGINCNLTSVENTASCFNLNKNSYLLFNIDRAPSESNDTFFSILQEFLIFIAPRFDFVIGFC